MRRQRLPSVSAAIDHPDPRAGPSDHEDLAREFERAVHQLRSQYRLVFQPYHEQSLSCEEIADSIDRPIGTVKTWLFRTRAKLAECLSRRGLE